MTEPHQEGRDKKEREGRKGKTEGGKERNYKEKLRLDE